MFNKFVPGCTWLIFLTDFFEFWKYIQVQKYTVQVQVQPSVTYDAGQWYSFTMYIWHLVFALLHFATFHFHSHFRQNPFSTLLCLLYQSLFLHVYNFVFTKRTRHQLGTNAWNYYFRFLETRTVGFLHNDTNSFIRVCDPVHQQLSGLVFEAQVLVVLFQDQLFDLWSSLFCCRIGDQYEPETVYHDLWNVVAGGCYYHDY